MAVMDATNVGEIAPTGANGQPVGGGDPAAENVTPADTGVAPSGLPSEGGDLSPWDRAKQDGYLPDDITDEYELAKRYKAAEDSVQEWKKEKSRMGHEAKEQETLAATKESVLEMVPEFMKNNMELTPDMLERAKELNIDEKDLKLGAYELRETLQAGYEVVGGEAEYAAMMSFMGERMSDQEKKAFNADLGGSASKYAIAGLHAEYKRESTTGETKRQTHERLEGKVNASPGGVKPYASQGEMLKDLNYLKTRGKTDKAARSAYEARKSITPDEILFGAKKR